MTDIVDSVDSEAINVTQNSNDVTLCALAEIVQGLDIFRGISEGEPSATENNLAQINCLGLKADAWRDLEIALAKCGLGDTQCGLVASVTCSALGIMSVALTVGQRPWDLKDIKDVYVSLTQLTDDLGTANYDALYAKARILRTLEAINAGLLPSRQTGVTRFMN